MCAVNRPVLLVSQRRDFIPAYSETRDCLDVRLSKLIWDAGFLPILLPSCVPNNVLYFQHFNPVGLLLSGGNDIYTSTARNFMESSALHYSKLNSLPVLGICRGMQFLNYFEGGSITATSRHTAVNHEISGPLLGNQKLTVNSYHDFGITLETISTHFTPTAWSDDGIIEAFHHKSLPWLGLMWHPERNNSPTSFDLNLIKSHFSN